MQFEKIILASQSPRRSQILQWAEIPFEVVVEPIAEDFPPGMLPEQVAPYIARNKAVAVSQKIRGTHLKNLPVLAADTIVVLDGRIMGKPLDKNDAVNMLGSLSGKTHSVITGVSMLYLQREHAFYDETRVTFHPLSTSQIEYYVDRYAPFDKAGSYAIQEWIGVTGIASVQGDFYNVMGLPVSRVIQLLDSLKK